MSRLLVIEDDSGNSMVLQSRLADQGYDLTAVATGAKGLVEARSGGYDLILVSRGLSSGVDGLEVCRRLKSAPETNGTPVVLFTNRASSLEEVDRCYEAGCEAFVTKAEQTSMDHVIRMLLRLKDSADRLADENRSLVQQNRRLAEERRQGDGEAPRDEAHSAALREVATGRPDGLLVVDCEGCVRWADRGACELLGNRLEGQHLGSLAPASGLEAFARDARIEARTGFRFDLAGRRNQPPRSLAAVVLPLVGHDEPTDAGLKILILYDAAKRRLAAELLGVDDSAAARIEAGALAEAARVHYSPAGLIGASPAMEALRSEIARALTDTGPVLLVGEPGSGRQRVARTLHYSGSATGSFVLVRCGALAQENAEAELFGYVRGALPGTAADRPGLLHQAHDGTILLADLEQLPAELHPKLAEVLRGGHVKRLGATRSERVDARWVATSRGDGAGSGELFDELSRTRIHVPALHECEGDVELLVRHLVGLFGGHRELTDVTNEALWCLEQHSWPGNVAELRDCIDQACARAKRTLIEMDDLPAWLLERVGRPDHDLIPRPDAAAALVTPAAQGVLGARRELRPWDITDEDPVSLDLYEKKALLRAIDVVGGDKLAAARLLKVGKSTLYRKLKRFNIH